MLYTLHTLVFSLKENVITLAYLIYSELFFLVNTTTCKTRKTAQSI